MVQLFSGKFALTKGANRQVPPLKLFKKRNGFDLLDIILHTGRTHQIRVHFSHLGLSLIGDDLYGGNHEHLPRQALHCHHLQFVHPFTEELIEIELDMPDDMKNLLK